MLGPVLFSCERVLTMQRVLAAVGLAALFLSLTGADTIVAQSARSYAGATSITSVTASTVNQVLLTSYGARVGAIFYNNSNSPLYLKLGAGAALPQATSPSFTIVIGADAYYEMPAAYIGEVDGVWSAVTGTNPQVLITELRVQ